MERVAPWCTTSRVTKSVQEFVLTLLFTNLLIPKIQSITVKTSV